MNYLHYKKKFPKSINLFFDWVSTRQTDGKSGYVDNIYFKFFFSEYFDYREYNQYTPYNSLYIEEDKEYFHQLKSELVKLSLDENYDYYFEKNSLILRKYSDTKTEYIRLSIKNEDSFESAFFILEILLENTYYGRK